MIRETSSLTDGQVIESDVCIAGAGAAGITLALELARRGLSVCVLEGGGTEREMASQTLYRGSCDPPLHDSFLLGSRVRMLGGSTNHWLGYCLTFDPNNFEDRPWLGIAGWPFGRDELDPFYRRAAELLGLEPKLAASYEKVLGDDGLTELKTTQVALLRFGEHFRQPLEESERSSLYLHANLVQIVLHEDGSHVSHLELARPDGRRFRAVARDYVLALGGIETPRMLLVSDGVQSRGVGNARDLVGRYFMDHPVYHLGHLSLGSRNEVLPPERMLPHFIFRLSEEVQRRERLLDCGLGVGAIGETEDTRHQLLRRSAWERFASYLESRSGAPEWPAGERISDALEDQPRLFQQRLHMRPEEPPLWENRVRLSESRDPFGNRRTHLRWVVDPRVVDTVLRTAEIFALELGRAGIGRVRIDQEAVTLGGYAPGYHHMGATRMDASPRRGVVDPQCRVHGVENLFVASSSVFPTSGFSNPTYTLLALTLRLGDHLVRRWERPR